MVDVANVSVACSAAAAMVAALAGSGEGGGREWHGTAASFDEPMGVAVDAGGNVYVLDLFNNAIRLIGIG